MAATMIAATLAATAAPAQEFRPDPVDEAAARREGTVTWYTATPVAAAQHIVTEFQKQTGIKVETLRAAARPSSGGSCRKPLPAASTPM